MKILYLRLQVVHMVYNNGWGAEFVGDFEKDDDNDADDDDDDDDADDDDDDVIGFQKAKRKKHNSRALFHYPKSEFPSASFTWSWHVAATAKDDKRYEIIQIYAGNKSIEIKRETLKEAMINAIMPVPALLKHEACWPPLRKRIEACTQHITGTITTTDDCRRVDFKQDGKELVARSDILKAAYAAFDKAVIAGSEFPASQHAVAMPQGSLEWFSVTCCLYPLDFVQRMLFSPTLRIADVAQALLNPRQAWMFAVFPLADRVKVPLTRMTYWYQWRRDLDNTSATAAVHCRFFSPDIAATMVFNEDTQCISWKRVAVWVHIRETLEKRSTQHGYDPTYALKDIAISAEEYVKSYKDSLLVNVEFEQDLNIADYCTKVINTLLPGSCARFADRHLRIFEDSLQKRCHVKTLLNQLQQQQQQQRQQITIDDVSQVLPFLHENQHKVVFIDTAIFATTKYQMMTSMLKATYGKRKCAFFSANSSSSEYFYANTGFQSLLVGTASPLDIAIFESAELFDDEQFVRVLEQNPSMVFFIGNRIPCKSAFASHFRHYENAIKISAHFYHQEQRHPHMQRVFPDILDVYAKLDQAEQENIQTNRGKWMEIQCMDQTADDFLTDESELNMNDFVKLLPTTTTPSTTVKLSKHFPLVFFCNLDAFLSQWQALHTRHDVYCLTSGFKMRQELIRKTTDAIKSLAFVKTADPTTTQLYRVIGKTTKCVEFIPGNVNQFALTNEQRKSMHKEIDETRQAQGNDLIKLSSPTDLCVSIQSSMETIQSAFLYPLSEIASRTCVLAHTVFYVVSERCGLNDVMQAAKLANRMLVLVGEKNTIRACFKRTGGEQDFY